MYDGDFSVGFVLLFCLSQFLGLSFHLYISISLCEK